MIKINKFGELEGSVCPECGDPIKPEWKACPHCGTRLSLGSATCSGCGSLLKPGWKACPECGKKIVVENFVLKMLLFCAGLVGMMLTIGKCISGE